MNVRLDASTSFRSLMVWRYSCIGAIAGWGLLALAIVVHLGTLHPRLLIVLFIGLIASAIEIMRLAGIIHREYRKFCPEYYVYQALLTMPEPWPLDELTLHPHFKPWFIADTIQTAAKQGYVWVEPERDGAIVTLTSYGRDEARLFVSH